LHVTSSHISYTDWRCTIYYVYAFKHVCLLIISQCRVAAIRGWTGVAARIISEVDIHRSQIVCSARYRRTSRGDILSSSCRPARTHCYYFRVEIGALQRVSACTGTVCIYIYIYIYASYPFKMDLRYKSLAQQYYTGIFARGPMWNKIQAASKHSWRLRP
jgi:hypothetical protein